MGRSSEGGILFFFMAKQLLAMSHSKCLLSMEKARPGGERGRVLLLEIIPESLPFANSQAWVIHLGPVLKGRIRIP